MSCWARRRASVAPRAPGQAVVELALLLPVLLLLVVGTIELGRAVLAQRIVASAAYRGSTFAAFSRVNALDNNAIREAVVADWGPLPMAASNPTVTVTLAREPTPPASSVDAAADAVTVDVRYTLATLLPWPGVPAIPTLQGRVTMRVQP